MAAPGEEAGEEEAVAAESDEVTMAAPGEEAGEEEAEEESAEEVTTIAASGEEAGEEEAVEAAAAAAAEEETVAAAEAEEEAEKEVVAAPVLAEEQEEEEEVVVVDAPVLAEEEEEVAAAPVLAEEEAAPASVPAEVSIMCNVWNVCGLDKSSVPAADLEAVVKSWLEGAASADIVCVGLVEIIELKPLSLIQNALSAAETSLARERLISWRGVFVDMLGGTHMLVAEESLVGLGMYLFTKLPSLSALQTCRFKTALFGTVGTKGALCARCELDSGKSLCLVHAHMASDLNQLAQRNAQYNAIVESRSNAAATLLKQQADGEPIDVLSHDLVIWMGDLNYRLANAETSLLPSTPRERIDSAYAQAQLALAPSLASARASFGLPPDPILPPSGPSADDLLAAFRVKDEAAIRLAIEEERWADLTPRDQLGLVRATGAAFAEFEEAPLEFPPTYKLGLNGYVANRRPAWCDRVLWRLRNGETTVTSELYTSVTDPLLSDHHPVKATLIWRPSRDQQDPPPPPRVDTVVGEASSSSS